MVVKFQKAILGGKKVLVYDKKETICQELPLTKEINELFAGRFKMYRKCTMDKDGKLWIGKEVRGILQDLVHGRVSGWQKVGSWHRHLSGERSDCRNKGDWRKQIAGYHG